MKKSTSIYSPSITSKGKASQSSIKPVKPGAPGSSNKSPRRSIRHTSPKKSSPRDQKKNSIAYDDYVTKTLLQGTLGQGSREIQFKIQDQGVNGNFVLHVLVTCTKQKWAKYIPVDGASLELLQAWRRAPHMRLWTSFCQGILSCSDIEFSDGVVLDVTFSGTKFEALMAQLLGNLVHEAAMRLQLAWLCFQARVRAQQLRALSKRRKKKKIKSGRLDEFVFGTTAMSTTMLDFDYSAGFEESTAEVNSVSTDITDTTLPPLHEQEDTLAVESKDIARGERNDEREQDKDDEHDGSQQLFDNEHNEDGDFQDDQQHASDCDDDQQHNHHGQNDDSINSDNHNHNEDDTCNSVISFPASNSDGKFIVHMSTSPGSDLDLEGEESLQELLETRSQLDETLAQMRADPLPASHGSGSGSGSDNRPGNSVPVGGSEGGREESQVPSGADVAALHAAVQQQLAMVEELKQQFAEMKTSASLLLSSQKLPEPFNFSSDSVYSVLKDDREELRRELSALREAQSSFEKKNESVMTTFVKAMEMTSQLAEEIKESGGVGKSSAETETSVLLEHRGEEYEEHFDESGVSRVGATSEMERESARSRARSEEYERLRARLDKDQMEKEVDIAFLKLSVDKLTRGLKQSKMQYEDLEIESKRQHDRLKEELAKQKQDYEDIQKKMHELHPKQQSKRQFSLAAKASLASSPSQAIDSKFQQGLDHAMSIGNKDKITKLQEYKMTSNRKRIYSSLEILKHQDLLRSMGVTALTEDQYAAATNIQKLATLRQLLQVKRVSRFLNCRALRWRLQASDPCYEQLAESFVEILATEKSAATLSEALRLGVRLRHSGLVTLALHQIYELLTQAYERNRKYFAPTLYTLLGEVGYLSFVMRVFFSSLEVQQECLQVIACIFVSSRSPEELENNLCPLTSGLFQGTVRVLLWHGNSVDLCGNALKVASKMIAKFQRAKESFCGVKQIKTLLGYAVKSTESPELCEEYVSLVCAVAGESLPLVLKLSEGGLSLHLSRCLQLKFEDVAIISIIAKAILSLFSSHGPIFIQEMFGNRDYFLAVLQCLAVCSHDPKTFKLFSMCLLAVCGQNLRIISRIPENEMAELMVNVLGDENLDDLVVMPALMTVSVSCLNEDVLKQFHARGLHTIIKRELLDHHISAVKEFAIKTHKIISDVDPAARLAEEEREESLRIAAKRAEEARIAQLEEERQQAARLVEELEEARARTGQVAELVGTSGQDVGEVNVRVLARLGAEQRAREAAEKEREDEVAAQRAADEERERARKAAELAKLRAELQAADLKAQQAVQQQEAALGAHAQAVKRVTEDILMDMLQEEILKVAQMEQSREKARLQKVAVEEAAAARIALMKEQIEEAERSAQLTAALDKAEKRAQRKAEIEEAEKEALARTKQKAADKIAQQLFEEDLSRKAKAKEGRVIQMLLAQQRNQQLQQVEQFEEVQPPSRGPVGHGMSRPVSVAAVAQEEQKAGVVTENKDSHENDVSESERYRSVSPAQLVHEANALEEQEKLSQEQLEKAERKRMRKKERAEALMQKVLAKKEAKKLAKRQERLQAEADRRLKFSIPETVQPSAEKSD